MTGDVAPTRWPRLRKRGLVLTALYLAVLSASTQAALGQACDIFTDCPATTRIIWGNPADPNIQSVEGTLTSCLACTPLGSDQYTITGQMEVQFGPYLGSCAPETGLVSFTHTGEFIEEFDPNGPLLRTVGAAETTASLSPPLRTDCVSTSNLPWQLPELTFGSAGVSTTLSDPATVQLPDNVRPTGSRILTAPASPVSSGIAIESIKLQTEGFSPAGMPFRVNADALLLSESEIQLVSVSGALPDPPFDVAYVSPSGPASDPLRSTYIRVRGDLQGSLAAFSVIDLDLSTAGLGGPADGISGLNLHLSQSNNTTTADGLFNIYLTEATGVDISASSGITYQAGQNGEASVDPAFLPLHFLGSFSFVEKGDGVLDIIPLNDLDPSEESIILAALNSGSTLRLILAPEEPHVGATYAGLANPAGPPPSLEITYTGKPGYEVVLPDQAGVVAFGHAPVTCQISPGAGESGCTEDVPSNAGFFFTADWRPGFATIRSTGLETDLELDPSGEVVYEPLYNHLLIHLTGPAIIEIDDSSITSGQFAALGEARYAFEDICGDPNADPNDIYIPLIRTASVPLLSAPTLSSGDASLMAAAAMDEVEWTYNRVSGMGCGTLYVPAALPPFQVLGFPTTPVDFWRAPADIPGTPVDEVLGRGMWAGLNYNPNGICSNNTSMLCRGDADCTGGTCLIGHFQPLCPLPAADQPLWSTWPQGISPSLPFVTDMQLDPNNGREAALVVGFGGPRAVLDAGTYASLPLPIGGFPMNFNEYGHAFRNQKSCGADTISSGAMEFPFPVGGNLPFSDLELCNCGQPKRMKPTEDPDTATLAYWDVDYKPLQVDFAPPEVSCKDVGTDNCKANKDMNKACVGSVFPLSHYTPDLDGVLALYADGSTPDITITSTADLIFDEYKNTGYSFQLNQFELDPYPGGIDPNDVFDGTVPYGGYNLTGFLEYPHFGLVDTEIISRREAGPTRIFRLDTQDPANPGSPVTAGRKIGDDRVSLDHALRYIPPYLTVDPNDGTGTQGQGSFYAWADALDLGSITSESGMVLSPGKAEGFLGALASLRLYADTDRGPDALAALGQLLPSGSLDGFEGTFDSIIDSALGVNPDLWNSKDLLFEDLHTDFLGESSPLDLLAGAGGGLSHPALGSVLNGTSDPPVNISALVGEFDFNPGSGPIELPLDGFLFDGAFDARKAGEALGSFERGQFDISKAVKKGKGMITRLARDAAKNGPIELPGKQSLPFGGSGAGLDVDVDISPPPSFGINSITGSLSLGGGAMPGVGFTKIYATLYIEPPTGDFYFNAGLDTLYNGYGARGNILFGDVGNADILFDLDPQAEFFIGDLDRFDGAYLSAGASANIISIGCVLRVNASVDAGTWFLRSAQKYGSMVSGAASVKAACLFSLRAGLSLGGQIVQGNTFELGGQFWGGAGIGFCEEDKWRTPEDVLSDKGCAACVISTGMKYSLTIESLPEKLELDPQVQADLTTHGPDAHCRP